MGHAMGSWPSEVPVDNDDGNQNREGVHNEGEEEVLGDEREDEGGRRKDLGHEQQEHNQWEEDGYTQGHFFTRLCRQVEDQDTQEGNQHCWQN